MTHWQDSHNAYIKLQETNLCTRVAAQTVLQLRLLPFINLFPDVISSKTSFNKLWNQNKIIGRPKVPFSQQYLIIIRCWFTISQKEPLPPPLSKISYHCYTAHSSTISRKSQGYIKNHPDLMGSHRCYLSAGVSATLRHSHWFLLPKEYGVNDLIIQVLPCQTTPLSITERLNVESSV